MRRRTHRALIAGILVLSAGVALAEVSTDLQETDRPNMLVMAPLGITDGVDPISQIWEPYRDIPSGWILNEHGDERGDGVPDVFIRRGSGWPVAVWAYRTDANHDIAISFWLGAEWSPVQLLTNTAGANELDPSIFVSANGTVYVSWWVESSDAHVKLIRRPAGEELWVPPMRVSPIGEQARRPTVAEFNGVVRVAYERDAVDEVFAVSEVAVRRVEATGSQRGTLYVVQAQLPPTRSLGKTGSLTDPVGERRSVRPLDAPDGSEVLLGVQREGLVDLPVEVHGELGDAGDRLVHVDEDFRAVRRDEPSGDAEIAVQPGVVEDPAVDLHPQLSPAERGGVGAGLDPQAWRIRVGSGDAERGFRSRALGDPPCDQRSVADHEPVVRYLGPTVRLVQLGEVGEQCSGRPDRVPGRW